VALGALALCGCDEFFEDLFNAGLCTTGSLADVNGDWVLSGTGERTNCRDDSRNGEITLRSATVWKFSQAPTTDSRTTFTGTLQNPAAELTDGEITNACVDFRTVETYAGAEGEVVTISIFWNGENYTDDLIEGDFTGSSSDGCEISGTFQLTPAP
jgi:hypothetical protein